MEYEPPSKANRLDVKLVEIGVRRQPVFLRFLSSVDKWLKRLLLHNLLQYLRPAAGEFRVSSVYRLDLIRTHWQIRGGEGRLNRHSTVPSTFEPFVKLTVSSSK